MAAIRATRVGAGGGNRPRAKKGWLAIPRWQSQYVAILATSMGDADDGKLKLVVVAVVRARGGYQGGTNGGGVILIVADLSPYKMADESVHEWTTSWGAYNDYPHYGGGGAGGMIRIYANTYQ